MISLVPQRLPGIINGWFGLNFLSPLHAHALNHTVNQVLVPLLILRINTILYKCFMCRQFIKILSMRLRWRQSSQRHVYGLIIALVICRCSVTLWPPNNFAYMWKFCPNASTSSREQICPHGNAAARFVRLIVLLLIRCNLDDNNSVALPEQLRS